MMKLSVKEQVVNELLKPSRIHYPRRKTTVKGLDDLWQIDLVEMQPYAKVNKGNRYILTIIDTLSKYAWSVPVKRKTGKEMVQAMLSIFKSSGRVPKNIQSDNGKEFYNKNFQTLMSKYNINHYSTFSPIKASIIERFNRTMKTRLWKKMHYQGSYSYLKLLPEVMSEYNNTVHSSILMKPSKVNKKHEKNLIKMLNKPKPYRRRKKLFDVGDHVRISKTKSIFSKGYTGNWSTEIFQISQVHNTKPVTYSIKDSKGQDISGKFYSEELQITSFPDVYLVEKVLRKKPGQLYVKYLGLNEKGWIKSKDIV